ncbi:MAG: GGDEF domain-containing protein [bacterium]|nr:GGDEF domain-containing protein [bacterium]
MTTEQWVIIGLSASTIILMILLLWQRRRQSQIGLPGLASDRFGELLNSSTGLNSIQKTAGIVSDLLVEACGCESILFLRKRRGILDLNFHYGLKDFKRGAIRIPFSGALAKEISRGFQPRSTEVLKKYFSDGFAELLAEKEMTLFFPVFWKEHLYGIYFVKTSPAVSTESRDLFMATLARHLSTAYHIKWHESKLNDIQNRMNSGTGSDRKRGNIPRQISADMLALVQHKNSDRLVVQVIDSIQKNLALKRIAFLYQPRNSVKAALIVRGENRANLKMPSIESVGKILSESDFESTITVAEMANRHPDQKDWFDQLAALGLEQITSLPLSANRVGLLAWSGQPVERIRSELVTLRGQVELLSSNAESYERIEEMSFTDPLTGLSNQRYFSKRLEEEIGRCRRYNRKLALIFFDLDNLKGTNDEHGHLAGDELLTQMGRILRETTRSIDVVARYGGDEFCVIMPESDLTICELFMDRLKKMVAESEFRFGETNEKIRCTISLGGAVFPAHAEEPKQLIHVADMALLQAKESGRNCYRLYDPSNSVCGENGPTKG